MRQTVGGASFAVSPTAFFQTNMAAAEILVGLVLDAVPRGARVVDLYAGAGLFAVPLAQAGCLVTAVEANREAVRDGEASRSLSGVAPDRCRFIARPVEASLASLRRADAVVLDPPREGCAASVVRHVFQTMRPAVAVYVSCSAETLARDLRLATGFGYAVRSIQPVDMFPHTAHIETVVVLTR
jgi:23S rRNA (uracil1939-C5)-methyltransferase